MAGSGSAGNGESGREEVVIGGLNGDDRDERSEGFEESGWCLGAES